MKRTKVNFHADDFGATAEVSRHILDCARQGALNSLSVLPNGNALRESMAMLQDHKNDINVSIHFNLAEGHCIAEPSEIPWLIDERGMFRLSFFKTLLLSFGPKRRELKRQIKAEMKAQLETMLPYIGSLRIDSHQHYHMIPVVLESILEAIEELPASEGGKKWLEANKAHRAEMEFIRVPAEPLFPFLKHPELYRTYRPINLLKNIVLNLCNILDHRLLKKYRKKSALFFGMVFSCEMDLERVRRLKPDLLRIAEKKGLPLEILCHPGQAAQADGLMDLENKKCVEFYTSKNRAVEKHTLMHIE